MKEITLKEKTYQIPDSFNDLPAKKASKLIALLIKQNSEERDLTDYNFSYISILLDEPKDYIESLKWGEFSQCLNEVNTIMNAKPIVPDEPVQ